MCSTFSYHHHDFSDVISSQLGIYADDDTTIHSCLNGKSNNLNKIKLAAAFENYLQTGARNGLKILMTPKQNCYPLIIENHFCTSSVRLMLTSRRVTCCVFLVSCFLLT